jgi:DNA polymerase-3 subunit delta'
LVSDIDGPVIAAASKTPFEAQRRVFVIERVDELGDEAANRMLKTLEEPASYVHLILLTDRLAEVLPTIRSRCQLVRFEAPSEADLAADVSALGVAFDTAVACARLSLGDGVRARELATADGQKLLAGAVQFARAALNGQASAEKPWVAMLAGVRARGDTVRVELEAKAVADLELYPKKERRRIETEWTERIRRVRRRVETTALDLALQAVSLWYGDLACLSWKAEDLVRHCDRLDELRADAAAHATATHVAAGNDAPAATRAFHQAVELVEDTRMRFQLNVSEELACEALAYRLERVLAHGA